VALRWVGWLIDRVHSRWLVWSIQGDALGAVPGDDPAGWVRLDERRVDHLFAAEPERRSRFLAFLRRGHRGVALADAGRWVAYGWLATPRSGPADHLPTSTAGRYWIFYCRTADDQRNRGHYRRALVALVGAAAGDADPGDASTPTVFIDTRDDNAPARSAIERLGFVPAGVVHLWRLPRTTRRLGYWRKAEAHGR